MGDDFEVLGEVGDEDADEDYDGEGGGVGVGGVEVVARGGGEGGGHLGSGVVWSEELANEMAWSS